VTGLTFKSFKNKWHMTLTVQQKKGLRLGLISLAVLLIGALIAWIAFRVFRKKEQSQDLTEKITPNPNELDTNIDLEEQKNVYNWIKETAKLYGFSPEACKAIAGVSAHETGRFNSPLAIEHNNIFGMKSGGAGKGIQSGEINGFAEYRNTGDSLSDHLQWLEAKSYPKDQDLTVEQHLQWMKTKKYFEDSLANYKKSVLGLINEMED
jgi:hypothetical protein